MRRTLFTVRSPSRSVGCSGADPASSAGVDPDASKEALHRRISAALRRLIRRARTAAAPRCQPAAVSEPAETGPAPSWWAAPARIWPRPGAIPIDRGVRAHRERSRPIASAAGARLEADAACVGHARLRGPAPRAARHDGRIAGRQRQRPSASGSGALSRTGRRTARRARGRTGCPRAGAARRWPPRG